MSKEPYLLKVFADDRLELSNNRAIPTASANPQHLPSSA